jgi:4-carboxymuconolactone decarboxylase
MSSNDSDRMPPIPAAEWTEQQKQAAAEFAARRKQDVFGPFAVLLRSPEVMLRATAMGDYLRYRTVLPPALNELAILLTARRWSQPYEWHVHQPAALQAGLAADIVAAVADGRRPERLTDDEAVVHDFCAELLRDETVSDQTYARVVGRFGEQGVVDLSAVVGYYTFLSMVMNTARTAVPDDSRVPPLPKIRG